MSHVEIEALALFTQFIYLTRSHYKPIVYLTLATLHTIVCRQQHTLTRPLDHATVYHAMFLRQ